MNDRMMKETAKLLTLAYEAWKKDQLTHGMTSAQASQTQFSRELGVPNTSFSQWVNGTRLPVGPNIDRLSDNPYIGTAIYKVLGVAPRMPNDPKLRFLAESWPSLSREQRQQVVDWFKKEVLGLNDIA